VIILNNELRLKLIKGRKKCKNGREVVGLVIGYGYNGKFIIMETAG
jgi:hypothetical protein